MVEHQLLMSLDTGTVVGDAFRHGWLPFLPSGTLDADPVQPVRLLGHNLVCYRDNSGTLGLVGEFCGHQIVGLKWGYPDEHGLRCSYHDWCYDERGRCIDSPLDGTSRTGDGDISSYAVEERGGVLFAHLGRSPGREADGPPDLAPGIEIEEVAYSFDNDPWVMVLERDLTAVAGHVTSPRVVVPNLLWGEVAPGGTLTVLVPVDELNTLRMNCRLGGPRRTTSSRAATAGRFVSADADEDYRRAVDLISAKARAFGTEPPSCGCSPDSRAAALHDRLLDAARTVGRGELAEGRSPQVPTF